MKVILLAHTPEPEKTCAAAARSCYSGKGASELISKGDTEKFLAKVVGMGHESVIEHATFTFSVEGVSRSLTHQLVRHRIASFSQQSQRYVSLEEPTYVVPPTVGSDPEKKRIYDEAMEKAWQAYGELERLGIPAEDARYVLPNGCTTNIVITMNARELRHLFTLRCCNRAQWEIREMADKMLELCREASPSIFKDAGAACVRGPCPEGKKSCGHPRRRGDTDPEHPSVRVRMTDEVCRWIPRTTGTSCW